MTNLAIRGGAPAFTGTYPQWPIWGEREEENLRSAMDERAWGTLGKRALAFAARFAAYIGTEYAVAVNSGTQALELMLRALDIGRGDEVIAPSYTFVATISAIPLVGATPVFAEVDPDTGCISPAAVERAITARTKAILCVHMAGRPCDLDALSRLSKERGIPLLEDCAHAHGCAFREKRVGSFGDAAAFSFQASKTLTAGEGGMVLTNNRETFLRLWSLHNSGRAFGEAGGATLGGRVGAGTNGRMTEWAAAVLDGQLDRLDNQNDLREQNVGIFLSKIKDIPEIRIPSADARISKQGYFLMQFRVLKPLDRDAFVRALQAEGVPCSAGYPGLKAMGFLESEDFFRATGARLCRADIRLPDTDALADTAVWIPGRYFLGSEKDARQMADAVQKVAELLNA